MSYTEAPSDSGVAGFVGTVDLKTRTSTPAIIGLTGPTGLGFICQVYREGSLSCGNPLSALDPLPVILPGQEEDSCKM
jgi:hypothetical protein